MTQETRPHCVRYKPRFWILFGAMVICAGGVAAGLWLLQDSTTMSDPGRSPYISAWLEEAKAQLEEMSDPEAVEQGQHMYITAAVFSEHYRSAEVAIGQWFPNNKRDAWQIAAKTCIAAGRFDQAEFAIRQIRNPPINRQLRRDMAHARRQLDKQKDQAPGQTHAEDRKRLQWARGAAMHADFETADQIARTIADGNIKAQAQLNIQTIRLAHRDPDQQPGDAVENPDTVRLMYLDWLVDNEQSERAWKIASQADGVFAQLALESWILRSQPSPDAYMAQLVWQRVSDLQPDSMARWMQLRIITERIAKTFARLDNAETLEGVLAFHQALADSPHAPEGSTDELSALRVQVRLDMGQSKTLAKEIQAASLSPQRVGQIVSQLSQAAPDLVIPTVQKAPPGLLRIQMLLGAVLRRSRLEQN